MRTQTLLIAAAAALAAAVTSSQAQTVYSANVVGYVNVTFPANSFSLIANQLDTGSNTVNNVLNNGFLSGSAGGSESVMLIWTGHTFEVFDYYNAADASPDPAGWYDANSGLYCTNTLNPSQSVFIQNPSSGAITCTLTGQVDQGTNTWSTVIPGFGFYSEPTALAGVSLDNTNVNFPATSTQDTVQFWTGTGYGTAAGTGDALQYYDAADASPSPAGWYDVGTGNYESGNPAYWPNVGAGFLIFHGGGSSNWVQSFEVQ